MLGNAITLNDAKLNFDYRRKGNKAYQFLACSDTDESRSQKRIECDFYELTRDGSKLQLNYKNY
jgi:hypothetical protein